ncbi:MAG: hypothetical protein OXT74_11120, partial [Candidatus Poribacteria bacterium]|nr:hypothetical protein [Candidatus Poribacteria bacterium]
MDKSISTNPIALISAFTYLVLLFGCGGEETVNRSVGDGDVTDISPTPTSSHYFPMTLGSRWVYRNPDNSEWSREVVESQVFDAVLYHSFSHETQIKSNQLDSLRSADYLTYFDRLVRKINLKDINDTVWQIILESGGESQNWVLRMSCRDEPGRNPVCQLYKNIFKPGILSLLFHSNTSVIWHSKLTPFRFPLVPGKTYTAFEIALRGKNEGKIFFHAYEAEGVIVGKISATRESVKTPTGAFEDCLKIQYEAKQTSFATVEFRADGIEPAPLPNAERKVVELTIREELTDLLTHLLPKLGLQTMWLAPGVGPVKIE